MNSLKPTWIILDDLETGYFNHKAKYRLLHKRKMFIRGKIELAKDLEQALGVVRKTAIESAVKYLKERDYPWQEQADALFNQMTDRQMLIHQTVMVPWGSRQKSLGKRR